MYGKTIGEARHLGQHPNIVQLLDVYDNEEGGAGKMIVMELARGGELSEYLQKTGKMTEEKAKGSLAKGKKPVAKG